MNKCLAIAALCFALAVPALAQQKLGEVQPTRSPAQVYSQVCGYCHGRNVGPVLLGRHLPAVFIKQTARVGLNGMPAFRPTEITDEELDAVAQWISGSTANPQEHGK